MVSGLVRSPQSMLESSPYADEGISISTGAAGMNLPH